MPTDDREVEDAREEYDLIENGLLDPGQPTRQAHERHVRMMQAEFTPQERRLIRAALFGKGDDRG